MNILLLNSNFTQCGRSRYPITPAPAGLILIAGMLKKHGHTVQIHQIHNHILPQDSEDLPFLCKELNQILLAFPADIIGISVRNIGAARKASNPFRLVEYYSVYYDARIVRAIKLLTNAPVVLGGTAFSIEPGLYMKYAQPDYGIIGEGEYSMLLLAQKLESKQSVDDIPGLVKNYSETKTKINNCSRVVDLSAIGIGACDAVTDFHKHYYEPGGFAPVQTKRGCALNCIYCTTPFIEGGAYRYRPISHILEEIKMYQYYWGIQHFFFVDATFNHPLEWAMEICSAILDTGLNIKWFSEITPLSVTDELCRLMSRSGCLALTLTPDSISNVVLEKYNKPFKIEAVINAIALLKKHNILFDTDIIVGGPGETMATFDTTMSFCLENLRHEPVSFYDGMIITTKAPVFDIAVKEGVLNRAKVFEDLVLNNNFKEMKKYEYFFPHIPNGRKEFLRKIHAAHLGKRWRVTSLDYAPDKTTGEYAAKNHILLDARMRPWAGWTRQGMF